jgi:hypothetical protein
MRGRQVRAAVPGAAALPDPLATALLRLGQGVALGAYFVPGLPLRRVFRDLAWMARLLGVTRRPFGIYRRAIAGLHDAARLVVRMQRHGLASVVWRLFAQRYA